MDDPKILKHTTAHHHRQWLDAVNDLALKAKGVEIYNCFEYETMRLHWNGCGLILHELCHLIHQLVLQDGLDNRVVLDAFGCALESGLYDEVLRRDWAFGEEETDAAYATINHKEFFSEISVAFLSTGYDAVCCWSRGQGQKVNGDDAGGLFYKDMLRCSPPFMAPEVLARRETFVGDYPDGTYYKHDYNNLQPSSCWMQGLIQLFQKLGVGLGGGGGGRGTILYKGHCNKFFPFTRGQLKVHDPVTFAVFQQLWKEIEQWEDPYIVVGNDTSTCYRMNSSISKKKNSGCWTAIPIPNWYRCKMMVSDAFQSHHDVNVSSNCITNVMDKSNGKDILNATVVDDGSHTDSVGSL